MNLGRADYNQNIIDRSDSIPETEPCFLLRAQDPFAPELLLRWAMKVRLSGGNPEAALSAEKHAQSMLDWQHIHGTKVSDLYGDNFNNSLMRKANRIIMKWIKENVCNDEELNEVIKTYDSFYVANRGVYPLSAKDKINPEAIKLMSEYRIEDFNYDIDRFSDCSLCIYINNNHVSVLKTSVSE